MARRSTNPLDLWQAGFGLWRMGLEAQATMTMRLMGLSGLWSVDRNETTRMIVEKPEAFGRAMMASTLALAEGKAPGQILDAAVKPVARKTRANARRLSRRGPKFTA